MKKTYEEFLRDEGLEQMSIYDVMYPDRKKSSSKIIKIQNDETKERRHEKYNDGSK